MNLYKSLLLSAVVVTSFGAVFAAQDYQPSAPEAEQVVAPVVATPNFFVRNSEKIASAVSEFAKNRRNEVAGEWNALIASKDAKAVLANKIVITGGIATIATVGAGIWAYCSGYFKKPAQNDQVAPLAEAVDVENSNPDVVNNPAPAVD